MYKKSFRDNLKIYIFLGFIIIILSYFSFRIFNLIYGPIITIYSPSSGEIVSGDTFILKGNIKNSKNIFLNGREIVIEENGDFKEELISKYPYTLVVIEAVDKYGKSKEKILNIGKE